MSPDLNTTSSGSDASGAPAGSGSRPSEIGGAPKAPAFVALNQGAPWPPLTPMTVHIDADGVPVAERGRYRRGVYTEIFLNTFSQVIEGHCPNCGDELRRSTGYCFECRINWSATGDGHGRRVVQVLEDTSDVQQVLTWSIGPLSPGDHNRQ